jgi:hypothetical protein
MATVSVRYIVDDVDAAIAFYCGHLAVSEKHASRANARDLRLVLSAPSGAGGGGGGQAMPDGTQPEPGGLESVHARTSRPGRRRR